MEFEKILMALEGEWFVLGTQEADGLVYAYFCNFGSKNWGQRSTGFEGFSWGFYIYIC